MELFSFATFWPVIALAISTGVTYLVTKYNASKKIGEVAEEMQSAGDEVFDVFVALLAAVAPDADGKVTITPEEVDNIKKELEDVIARYWPDEE